MTRVLLCDGTVADARGGDIEVSAVHSEAGKVEVGSLVCVLLLVANKLGKKAAAIGARGAALSLVHGGERVVEDRADDASAVSGARGAVAGASAVAAAGAVGRAAAAAVGNLKDETGGKGCDVAQDESAVGVHAVRGQVIAGDLGVVEGSEHGENVVVVREVCVDGLVEGEVGVGEEGAVLSGDVGSGDGGVREAGKELLSVADTLSAAGGAHEAVVAWKHGRTLSDFASL